MSVKYSNIFRTSVTGLSHSDYALRAKRIDVGDEFELRAETSNQFDGSAVGVYHDDAVFGQERIGWLSNQRDADGKKVICKMLKTGVDLKCVVISHDRNESSLDRRLYVGVFLAVEQ